MDTTKNINVVFPDKKTFRSDLDDLIFTLSQTKTLGDFSDDIGNIIEELTSVDDRHIFEKSQQYIIPLYQKLKKINIHNEIYIKIDFFIHYYFHINNKDRCLKTLEDVKNYYKSINKNVDIDGIVNCLSKIDKENDAEYDNEVYTLSDEEHTKLHDEISQLSLLESEESDDFIKYKIEQITIFIFSVISIDEKK